MNHYDNFWGDLPEFQDGTHAKRARSKHSIERRIAVMEMGRNVCFGGGKGGGDAPSPDPRIGMAAMKNAEIGEDWLAFAREQFAAGNVRQDEMDDLTTAVIDQQLVTAEQQAEWATKDRERYETSSSRCRTSSSRKPASTEARNARRRRPLRRAPTS
jgi:hypothetical protein